jgi:drug/metabolite transporter (DMT)-like permease
MRRHLDVVDAEDHLHHSRRLQIKTFPFILLSIVLGPLGNVLLGKGMKRVGSLRAVRASELAGFAERTLTSPWLWLGIGCLLAFFVVQMLLLTWADYSYVQPASALAYASVAILSYFLLGETVPPLRWAGVAVICAGVLIVGRTSPRTTGTA